MQKKTKRPKRLTKQALERRRRLRGQRQRRFNESKWALYGLVKPDPNQPELGTRKFEKLREAWYAKVAASEQAKIDAATTEKAKAKALASKFTDIEWAGNPESPHIRMPASRGRKLAPGKQLYYALGRNFLTHFRFKSLMEKTAWSMHIDGLSYRKIYKHLKTNYKLTKSIYWLFYYIKATNEKCKRFNVEHVEGLLNPANQDSFASDALIGDFQLASASDQDGGYGLPVDAGFWESVPKPK